jgi:hypothetical protein
LFVYLPRMFAAKLKLFPIRVGGTFNGLAILVCASGFGSLVGCASQSATSATSATAATTETSSPTFASTESTATSDPVGSVPSDLWIEVDVSPGRGVKDRAKIEERAARFVLLPDGSLHGEADRVPHDELRPARVRRLSREQMVDVWSTLRSLGFADAGFADTRGNPKLVEPAAGEVLATLEVHANGERYVFVRRYQPGGDDQPAMRRMVRSIASLAWSSDEALAETAELPLRYDLGSDPYARFAKPAVTPPTTDPSTNPSANPSTTPTTNPTPSPTPAPANSPSGSAKP